jgi:hypothetical protein
MVHLPAPTVSFSQQQGFQWHWLYF